MYRPYSATCVLNVRIDGSGVIWYNSAMMQNLFTEKPIKTPDLDLTQFFPRFTRAVTDLGPNDSARGWKMRTSPRVIARVRKGKIPVRWMRLPPHLWREFADDLEALRDSGNFERVYKYIESYQGKW